MPTNTKPLISIVDDDVSVREALAGLMMSLGFAAADFASAADFLAFPQLASTCCLIADVHMPEMTGIELHRRLIELGQTIPTVLITAYPDDGDRARALADGVICYLKKPFDENALIGCVHAALERSRPGAGHS